MLSLYIYIFSSLNVFPFLFNNLFSYPCLSSNSSKILVLISKVYFCPFIKSPWNGDINWVTPAELSGQMFYGETERKLSSTGAKGLYLMPVGTVLLSSRAPIGKLAITKVPMCCNQGFKNIVCNDSVDNFFLYYTLLQRIEQIKALGRGATFKEVSKSSISSYKIIVPPLSLQKSFAKRIISIEQKKEQINSVIKDLETIYASRMQYWFE